MVGSAEKGGAKHSRLCVTSGAMAGASFSLVRLQLCCIYIYIEKRRY
jgi:hypothetical protein